jgi:hypothetical protein
VPVLVGVYNLGHKDRIDRFREYSKAEREAQPSCFIENRNVTLNQNIAQIDP